MKTTKRTHSQRIKEGIARKKALKSVNERSSLLTGELTPVGESAEKGRMATVDTRAFAEFHYRRGLVTALECILRELR